MTRPWSPSRQAVEAGLVAGKKCWSIYYGKDLSGDPEVEIIRRRCVRRALLAAWRVDYPRRKR